MTTSTEARHVSHLRGEDDRTVCGAPWQGWQLNVPRLVRQRHDGVATPPPHLPAKPREEIAQCPTCRQISRPSARA